MTRSPKTILIGGGARSGKSRFALRLARQLGQRRAFLATAEPIDREMADRIEQHQGERGDDFETIEEPLDLFGALERLRPFDVVVIDCLTIWLSNLLVHEVAPAAILERVEQLTNSLTRYPFHRLLVTNEVGMGLVPETPLGRVFRDLTGQMHQRLAGAADEVYLGALGSLIRLRPPPITVVS